MNDISSLAKLCVLPSVELTQHMSQYTHLCTHTLDYIQLQTTSKENAGVQKNVVSLITRNRITVCKSVYIHVPTNVMFVYLLHSEILVVNIYVLPSSHLSHMHTSTHTHTHTTRTFPAKVGYLWQRKVLRNCH